MSFSPIMNKIERTHHDVLPDFIKLLELSLRFYVTLEARRFWLFHKMSSSYQTASYVIL